MQFDIEAPLLHDMVRLHSKWYPDKAAVIDEQKTLTWREIDLHSNSVANGLIQLGVEKGDSVAVLMSNCVEYAEIMFGILKAGAVIVPLNLAVNEDGLITMLNDAAVKVMFFTPEQYTKLAAGLHDANTLVAHITHGEQSSDETLNYLEWRGAQASSNPMIDISDDDVCNIIYSSGTTGQPKGIKHIHGRRTQSMYELALAHRYHYGVVSICPIGLYSNIAWASLFCTLIVGGTCVVQDHFDPKIWIDTVKKYRVSHTMMVPLQFQKILEADNFSSEAVASMEAIISGGSPLYAGLKKRVIDDFRCAVIELYGLTEGFMTTLQPDEAEGRLASVGKPVRGHDYIIVDDDDSALDWGNSGEICARSIHWMIGYHNRPDATEEAMYFDKDGVQWLRTGDIGKVDEQGYLYIVDRKKDMVLSGGQNIYPADIEAVMIEHPSVAEVAVIGIPDEKWGESPLALVVPTQADTTPSAEQILQWTNKNVGKRQRVKRVELRSELPRNPNGKILKRELRKEYW
ncbi:MAG: class I adenylate-forming enzyme family protein [Pseudomonadales bacterium]